jgi:hypothetical protein
MMNERLPAILQLYRDQNYKANEIPPNIVQGSSQTASLMGNAMELITSGVTGATLLTSLYRMGNRTPQMPTNVVNDYMTD